ncbi:glycosyltransferase [Loigolactobacillus jiayinensis]|uniref:Glycosyltransferase n=1 Tax=Loigolactobacillus jiayinensis TaxID=2486016 RepID=A0ABW1RF97_9LACO|nr:glycosyltransferase [Loigolactobacillus jiayinensis]
MDIDIVLPWVDGSDARIAKKREIALRDWNLDTDLNSSDRFRDTDLLKYSIASIKRFAPWVHKVYLVTDGQRPDWFIEDDVFTVVDHTEFIPEQYLPTFNSNVIELNISRIAGLSDHFILFNDDMILNRPVIKQDFFAENGDPKDSAIYSVIPTDDYFSHIILNNVIVLNRHFAKWAGLKHNWRKYINFKYGKLLIRSILSLPWHNTVGFYNPHTPLSYKKSNFDRLWRLEPELLDNCSRNKFRTKSDISHWLIRYFQLQSGDFSPRDSKFSKFYEQSETNAIVKDVQSGQHKMLCINDSDRSNLKEDLPPILESLNEKFNVE